MIAKTHVVMMLAIFRLVQPYYVNYCYSSGYKQNNPYYGSVSYRDNRRAQTYFQQQPYQYSSNVQNGYQNNQYYQGYQNTVSGGGRTQKGRYQNHQQNGYYNPYSNTNNGYTHNSVYNSYASNDPFYDYNHGTVNYNNQVPNNGYQSTYTSNDPFYDQNHGTVNYNQVSNNGYQSTSYASSAVYQGQQNQAQTYQGSTYGCANQPYQNIDNQNKKGKNLRQNANKPKFSQYKQFPNRPFMSKADQDKIETKQKQDMRAVYKALSIPDRDIDNYFIPDSIFIARTLDYILIYRTHPLSDLKPTLELLKQMTQYLVKEYMKDIDRVVIGQGNHVFGDKLTIKGDYLKVKADNTIVYNSDSKDKIVKGQNIVRIRQYQIDLDGIQNVYNDIDSCIKYLEPENNNN